MKVVTTFQEARSLRVGAVGVVPTMGFLHEGHLSLVEGARRDCDTVLMTQYVNPLQFDDAADLDRYPREPERDLRLADSAGVDVVFAPDAEVMFAERPATVVGVPAMAASMEGVHRPGHFEGVATVVAKLFAGLQPDRAYFGRKDAQQLAIVRRLVTDLSFPIDVVGMPIVRESDGLALSSRNVFLDGAGRNAALELSGALDTVGGLVEEGERDAGALVEAAQRAMSANHRLEVEYAQLASRQDAAALDALDRPAFFAVAARVGDVRLIDNVHLDVDREGVTVDRGVRLAEESLLYAHREQVPLQVRREIGDADAAGDRHR